jgi:adenylosuccinate synthase
VGREFGVTTGRKRRCGWLDIPVIRYKRIYKNKKIILLKIYFFFIFFFRYGNMYNGYSSLNMTKLDVMSDLDEL